MAHLILLGTSLSHVTAPLHISSCCNAILLLLCIVSLFLAYPPLEMYTGQSFLVPFALLPHNHHPISICHTNSSSVPLWLAGWLASCLSNKSIRGSRILNTKAQPFYGETLRAATHVIIFILLLDGQEPDDGETVRFSSFSYRNYWTSFT